MRTDYVIAAYKPEDKVQQHENIVCNLLIFGYCCRSAIYIYVSPETVLQYFNELPETKNPAKPIVYAGY